MTCLTHGRYRQYRTVQLARSAQTHPDEFCAKCAAIVREKGKVEDIQDLSDVQFVGVFKNPVDVEIRVYAGYQSNGYKVHFYNNREMHRIEIRDITEWIPCRRGLGLT